MATCAGTPVEHRAGLLAHPGIGFERGPRVVEVGERQGRQVVERGARTTGRARLGTSAADRAAETGGPQLGIAFAAHRTRR